ncbi:FCD domain-containing protein [Streptomyces olivochromogenes]|uniref:FCD domain-containing protein n=1 Tax=Streptomyces olivochromogenes TaxID=1963 RepID=UPI0036D907B7
MTDVYEVRILVEVQAARLTAARRTPEDVTALDGDADTAGTVLRGELEETLALLRRPVTRTPYVPE